MAVTREILLALISDARTAVDLAEGKRVLARAAYAKANSAMEEVGSELTAYEATLARLFPDAVPTEPTITSQPVELEDWTSFTRAHAVQMAVRQTADRNGFATVTDILAVLPAHGVEITRNQIGGATAYLNRNHLIHSIGRARWVDGPPTDVGEP